MKIPHPSGRRPPLHTFAQASPSPLSASLTLMGALGITVADLPMRSLLKSEAKYFVKVMVDGVEGWRSREIRTRGSSVVWDGEEDRHQFECTRASTLRIALYKNHKPPKPVEELCTAKLSIDGWVAATGAIPLVSTSASKVKASIRVQLSPASDDKPTVDPTVDDPVGLAVRKADKAAAAMHTPAALDKIEAGIDNINGVSKPATDIASALKPLVSNLEWFMDAMDVVTEVHPYAKTAWIVVSAAYKAVQHQHDRDGKILELVEKMKSIYDFVSDARELQKIKQEPGADRAREGALSRLSRQTEECGRFISTYAENPRFFRRLIKQSISKVDKQIDDYNISLDELKQDFVHGSQVRMEIVTTRVLEAFYDHAMDMDIEKIPYAGGAGYDSSKGCLENTRERILDDIEKWACNTANDAAQVFVLMGPAGTGKSTIAHTIASRLAEKKQLVASFCFDSKEGQMRTSADLFRNVARELSKFDSGFKLALWNEVAGQERLCTTKNIEEQFDKFIRIPAKGLSASSTVLIVVDALDESGKRTSEKHFCASSGIDGRTCHTDFVFWRRVVPK
ncbi:hypothetical protein CALVIDRAFT_566892 [Calocera viscosa TUFC12733]|uniref:Nephrocystin 3-like N-terminal domain-containing protein n=1 Tax=Calocera viscosa (strain TUFC12733) TaxID=1330018 RepID=A0A167IU74_CALVF|nr:hypothetical protein CALVIDRAFT_566892 [Calocera viscosa TUFC12733]